VGGHRQRHERVEDEVAAQHEEAVTP
jgi:hypothetical protein